MKQFFLIVTFFLCLLYGHAQQLKVLTYNIHHGYNASEHPSLDSIAAVISGVDADIVGLEEVDSVCQRSGRIDQPNYLSQKLGMQSVFVQHFPYQGGSYGLCLLSKFKIEHVKNVRFPILLDSGKTEYIALLVADIVLPKHQKTKVIVAHLDYRSAVSRVNQANFIIDYCKNIKTSILLMGDFNAPPNTKEADIIKGSFHDVSEGQSYLTFPDNSPIKKIDYVFFRPGSNWEVKKTEVPNSHASDHLPLLAILKYEIKK